MPKRTNEAKWVRAFAKRLYDISGDFRPMWKAKAEARSTYMLGQEDHSRWYERDPVASADKLIREYF